MEVVPLPAVAGYIYILVCDRLDYPPISHNKMTISGSKSNFTPTFIRVAFLIYACLFTSNATTLLSLWTPDGVLIGTDSLIAGYSRAPTGQTIARFGCKLTKTADCAFGMAGLPTNRETSFDAPQIGREACRQTGDISARAKWFVENTRNPLQATVNYMRRNHPRLYNDLFLDKGILQVHFAGKVKDRDVIIAVGFMVNRSGRLVSEDPIVLGGPTIEPVAAGSTSAAQKYLDTTAPMDFNRDPVKSLRRMINLEIQANPGAVGGPVTILRVQGGKSSWVEQGKCQ